MIRIDKHSNKITFHFIKTRYVPTLHFIISYFKNALAIAIVLHTYILNLRYEYIMLKQWCKIPVILTILVLIPVQASHFRGAIITWKPGTRQVITYVFLFRNIQHV
jgi:hypothetical protein